MVADWDVQTYAYWTELLAREAKDPKLPKSGLKVGLCIPTSIAFTRNILTVYLDARLVSLLGRSTQRRSLVVTLRARLSTDEHHSGSDT